MKNKINRPPKFGEFFLRFFLPEEEYYEKLGDFEEGYYQKLREKGRYFALFWYWLQIIIAIPTFIKNLINWRCVMLKNYFTIAWMRIRTQAPPTID